MKKILSIVLVLAMMLSLCSTAFAAEVRKDDVVNEAITAEDIEFAKDVYDALTPEARAIFNESLTNDMELLQFHKTYVDPSSDIEFTPKHRARAMAATAVANPMTVLNAQFALINLPQAVKYSLQAMGAGMAAALADGPLPVGDILLAATTASAVVVIAANWDAVYPKFGQITSAFQKAFSTTANNISSAFAQIKSDAKKEADKKAKEKKPTGNRVKDVQNRLKKEGFKKTGQSGSHEKWKKGDKTVTVPNHGSNYEIPIGTLRNIWKQAGWI